MRKKSSKTVYISIISLLILSIFTTLSLAGKIEHKIYNPYGIVVAEAEESYTSGVTVLPTSTNTSLGIELTGTTPITKYKEIDDYGESDDIKEPFCQVGGNYKIKMENDASSDTLTIPKGKYDSINIKYNKSIDLFYCQTTYDFIQNIKIPSDWISSDIILYCNDGVNINVKTMNFDLFTTQLSTYKACIIKNMDKDEKNTILYVMEVGNSTVDSTESYFYNETTYKGPIIGDLKHDSSNKFVDEDTDREYYVHYDDETNILVLSESSSAPTSSISSLFDTSKLELSRVALFKKINGKKILGYETITRNATDVESYNDSLKTLYTIELSGFSGYGENICDEVLAKYEVITNSVIDVDDDVSCIGNKIEIVSESLDSSSSSNSSKSSSSTSWHLFKNIILSLE